ncbi:MFS transporter [Pseudomonas sp. F1_0610]|uniref:MFS transporter n=1 Tax=Pseudomonas sp. F1_0610 TaxID=3114284 RepID=UPI0039C044D2
MQKYSNDTLTPQEMRAAGGLSLVFAFRMLGMFMVLPVMMTYGTSLQGATPALLGFAIGAYGLTQALLQIPFGMLSDRFGRMPIIYLGLLLFALGSLVAGYSDSIWGVILGRILQGTGAISAAVMALLSDLTREQHRTKAMAMIGMSIGLSFAIAMVIGPLLTKHFALSGLFYATGIMALVGIVITALVVPKPQQRLRNREAGVNLQVFMETLKDRHLLRLDFSILILHSLLMASFIALPLQLVEQGGLAKEQHWWVYLVAVLLGFFSMIPFIIIGEKKRQMKKVLIGAVTALLLIELYFAWLGINLVLLVIGFILFFCAFNLLEASLPSLISKQAPAGNKGTAMGIYSTSQFLGAALGGILGGKLLAIGGTELVFIGCAVLAVIWLLLVCTMQEPPYVTSMRLNVVDTKDTAAWLKELNAQEGVADVSWVEEESAVYIKFDTQLVNRESLERIVPCVQA